MAQKKLQNRFYCKVSSKMQITIPRRLQRSLNIRKGNVIKLDIFEDRSVDFRKDADPRVIV